MKYIIIPILIIGILLTGCDANNDNIGNYDIAIEDVNIVNVENGEIQNNMTVIISDNQISSIGKTNNIRLSGTDNIVDGKGKYLIPGLWDMHTHLFNESAIRNVNYPLFVANGIAGIRLMAADCLDPPCEDPNMTINQHRNLQNEISKGTLLGPRSILASYYINGALKGESTVPKPRTEEHGRELARLLKERGVDFIKIYDELTPEAYYGLIDEAKKLYLDFAGHVPLTMKSSEVSEAGQKSIEHCCDWNLFIECSELEDDMRTKIIEMFRMGKEGNMNVLSFEMLEVFDSIKCQNIYQLFKQNNTWFVPTLRLMEVVYPDAPDWKQNPNAKYMPKGEFDYFANEYDSIIRNLWGSFHPKVEEKRRNIVSDMNEAGVGLLAGSDAGELGLIYGFSLHEELISLQNAGLTPLEVLQTATINPAKYQNALDSSGTIEQGKVADLILLNKNPLEDIRNTQEIEGVFTYDRYLNRKDLDSLLLVVENYIKNEN
jgi:hypothetical protein